MFEWLNANVLWWHWIILGLAFIGLETVAMTFLMLGIGVASIVTGLLTFFFGFTFSTELV